MSIITRKALGNEVFHYAFKIAKIGIVAALLLLPWIAMSVLAVEQSSECTSANTLYELINLTGSPVESYTDCDWGCDAELAQCKPHPLVQYSVFFGFVLGVVFLFAVLWKKG